MANYQLLNMFLFPTDHRSSVGTGHAPCLRGTLNFILVRGLNPCVVLRKRKRFGFFPRRYTKDTKGNPLTQRSCCRDTPAVCPGARACVTARGFVHVSRDAPVVGCYRAEARPTSLECRGPLHNTNTRRNKNPRPAESVAVCGRKLQSKGLGFGANCTHLLAFAHSSRTETYGTLGGD